MNTEEYTISGEIYIEPMPAPRPRFSRTGARNTEKYTLWKAKVSDELRKIVSERNWIAPSNVPVHIFVKFFVDEKPYDYSGQKEEWMHNYRYASCNKDLDNYAKAFFDAANTILWRDDRQLVSVVIKKYSAKGSKQKSKIAFFCQELIND